MGPAGMNLSEKEIDQYQYNGRHSHQPGQKIFAHVVLLLAVEVSGSEHRLPGVSPG
jgi:hypothetical protein